MQWKKPSFAVMAACLIGAAGAAQGAMHGDKGHKGASFDKIDTNGDGVVSLEEAREAGGSGLAKKFQKYDANGDEEIDQGEFARFEKERAQEMKKEGQKKSGGMMDDE